MPKQAAKKATSLANSAPGRASSTKAASPPPTGPTEAQSGENSLPASIVAALPSGAAVISHVRAIEALLPKLSAELDKAQKDGHVMLARAFVVLHRLNERMLSDEKAFKGYKEVWRNAKELRVPQSFEAAGVDSAPLSEGFRVGVTVTKRASIVPGQKEAAFVWLQDNDKADIIQPTVNASTLSSLAKDMAEKNEELPEALFKVYDQPNVSVTKTK